MLIDTEGVASKLSMKNLFFKDFHFERSEASIDDTALRIRVKKSIDPLGNDDYKITLVTRLSDDSEKMNLKLTAIAIFNLKPSPTVDEAKIRDIIENNTVAIMFPYIRSQISLLTTQPEMTPVILPAININKLLER